MNAMSEMQIGLIYAQATNGIIGKNGVMPWHIPEDLAHFRAITQGCPVIMGRKTWESLPERFRPLPGRSNIVITRQQGWQAPGALLAHSLPEALATAAQHAKTGQTLWVMGGAQIYAQALPLAQVVEVTHIEQNFDGDAYAPTLGAEWQPVAERLLTSAQGLALRFVSYRKQLTASEASTPPALHDGGSQHSQAAT